ncbi:ABC transporter permease [Acidisoma cladoniae]|jgi:spermidine/putrescine transport system permease protein|uniref:ABC transporter permease n=1 Tax=Acidisoma cladoniae TaxID=3040935 RepID=UPI0025504285|nr:ABC transporter permease [Acidisoma sp. PAMC 29798]
MKRRSLFETVINLPAALIAVTGVLFALGLLLVLSFRQNDGMLVAWAFTTDNFTDLVDGPLFGRILGRSVIISGLASLTTVLLAYPVAYFITFRAGNRRALWLILVTLPFWTSYLLRVFAWKTILGYNGILNSALVRLHIPGAPFESLLYNPGAVVVTLAHAYAAFAILPIFVSLSAIDPKLIEAGLDLGAAPAVFRRVVLPLSLPGVAAAFVLVFVPTLGDYATPLLVGGPTSTMIGNLIQDQFGSIGDWPAGAAMAVTVMAALALTYGLGRAALRGWQRFA